MGSPKPCHSVEDGWRHFFENRDREWTDDSDVESIFDMPKRAWTLAPTHIYPNDEENLDYMFDFRSNEEPPSKRTTPERPQPAGSQAPMGTADSTSREKAARTPGSRGKSKGAEPEFYSMNDSTIKKTARNASSYDAYMRRKRSLIKGSPTPKTRTIDAASKPAPSLARVQTFRATRNFSSPSSDASAVSGPPLKNPQPDIGVSQYEDSQLLEHLGQSGADVEQHQNAGSQSRGDASQSVGGASHSHGGASQSYGNASLSRRDASQSQNKSTQSQGLKSQLSSLLPGDSQATTTSRASMASAVYLDFTQISPLGTRPRTVNHITALSQVKQAQKDITGMPVLAKGAGFPVKYRRALRKLKAAVAELERMTATDNSLSQGLQSSSYLSQQSGIESLYLRGSSSPGRPITSSPPQSRIPLDSLRESLGNVNVQGRDSQGEQQKESPQALPPKQIFEFCRFYLLPANSDSAERRDLTHAIEERGGTVRSTFNHTITHVAVEPHPKGLRTYDWVLKKLQLKHFPYSSVMMLTEWIKVCITWNQLIDPVNEAYQVPGYSPYALRSPTCRGHRTQARRATETGSYSTEEKTTSASENDGESDAEALARYRHAERMRPVGTPSAPMPALPPHETLEGAIKDLQSLQSLPFDSSTEATSDRSNRSEEDQESPKDTGAINAQQIQQAGQQTSERMHSHEIYEPVRDSPNMRVIHVLQEMADYYRQTKDHFREKAYRQAISVLRREQTKILTKEEALALPGIGEKLATKIDEIRRTDKLLRLENARVEPDDKIVRLFTGIYGVGYAQARLWIAKGHRTLEDLLQKEKVTDNQRIGILHYDDFQVPICREEVRHHVSVLRGIIETLDCKAELSVAGSYRRGAETCGDMDFIVTCPDRYWEKMRTKFSSRLYGRLQFENYVRHVFAHDSNENGAKLLVAACIPREMTEPGTLYRREGDISREKPDEIFGHTWVETWRRVKILLVPEREFGAAMLYFTGNAAFNRSMRLLAGRKGMRLNQHGLFKDGALDAGGKKVAYGQLVEGEKEDEIFRKLGVPWKHPNDRNP